jgi:hypothetical protein
MSDIMNDTDEEWRALGTRSAAELQQETVWLLRLLVHQLGQVRREIESVNRNVSRLNDKVSALHL